MTKEANLLKGFIVNNIGLQEIVLPNYYHSLAVCILDDIYSLNARYASALNAVKRYANHYLNGDLYTADYSIDQFVQDLEQDGLDNIIENIVKNRQMIGKRRKLYVCYDVAKLLQKLNIQTLDDFHNYHDLDYLDYSLRKIKGIGNAAIDYLFMMVGDDDRVKPDIHIHRCIRDAIGYEVSDEMCQILFKEVSDNLIKSNPKATPRFLDGIVWQYYSKFKV